MTICRYLGVDICRAAFVPDEGSSTARQYCFRYQGEKYTASSLADAMQPIDSLLAASKAGLPVTAPTP